MFENLISLFKKFGKKDQAEEKSKNTAKERLHLVLMQDRANVSADFLDMMRQEIVEVIKKYIDVDEKDIDVKLTNKTNDDGTMGAPALYANIPITGIKEQIKQQDIETKVENKSTEISEESKKEDIENEKQETKDSNQEEKEEIVEKKEEVSKESEKEIKEELPKESEKEIKEEANNNAQKSNKNKRKKSNKK